VFGWANDVGRFCWKMMVLMVQDESRFVEQCEILTTPGWLQGGNSHFSREPDNRKKILRGIADYEYLEKITDRTGVCHYTGICRDRSYQNQLVEFEDAY
jgi:hypothetical protein